MSKLLSRESLPFDFKDLNEEEIEMFIDEVVEKDFSADEANEYAWKKFG